MVILRSMCKAVMLLLLCSINLVSGKNQIISQIPITGMEISEPETLEVQDFSSFLSEVQTGAVEQITGLYVPDVFAFPVIQQPPGHPEFVSSSDQELTQFGMATEYGSLGLLAHNTLAGEEFSKITPDMLIIVITGDGHYSIYIVKEIRRFQAYSPFSPYSNFYDLDTGDILTATDVFRQTYMVQGSVILQTCIASKGIDNWGRLFIIATPVSLEPPME